MKHSLKDHSGYLIIDHTDSPGIDPSMIPERLRESTIVVPEGEKLELDGQNCTHCERFIVFNPGRIRPRIPCPYCYHYICDSCREILDKTGTCTPIRKLFDKVCNALEHNDRSAEFVSEQFASEQQLVKLTDI